MTTIHLRTLALLGVLLATIGLASAGPAAQPPAKASQTKLGEYAVQNYEQIKTHLTATAINADLTGPHLKLISPLYDLSAPNIHVELGKGGTPPRYKVTKSVATGGVLVVVRDAKAKRKTVLTSDRADYHATANPTDKGVIVLTGHVHSVTTDPALAEPLVQDSERTMVTFVDAETTDIEAENGGFSATPIEPAPRESSSKKPAHP